MFPVGLCKRVQRAMSLHVLGNPLVHIVGDAHIKLVVCDSIA